MNIFTALAWPFLQLLQFLTTTFAAVGPLKAIGAFGLAVIVVTLLIRAVLFPVFHWQLRLQRKIQNEQRMVAPQLQELRKKYKKEPQKLSAEMNKLYREHGISPFSSLSGCLPALVQMPVLIGLYTAIRTVTNSHLLATAGKGFLWIPDLSQSAVTNGNWSGLLTHAEFLILPLIAAAFTFAQSRMMMPPPRPDMSDQERSMANVSKQMSLIFPVMIFIFRLILPQGLAIYWATGTAFMVLQQFIIVGWGGLKVPAWFPGAARVTKMTHPEHAAARRGLPSPAAALVAPSQPKAADNNGKNGQAATAGNGTGRAAVPRTQTAQRALARAEARSKGNARRRRRR